MFLHVFCDYNIWNECKKFNLHNKHKNTKKNDKSAWIIYLNKLATWIILGFLFCLRREGFSKLSKTKWITEESLHFQFLKLEEFENN